MKTRSKLILLIFVWSLRSSDAQPQEARNAQCEGDIEENVTEKDCDAPGKDGQLIWDPTDEPRTEHVDWCPENVQGLDAGTIPMIDTERQRADRDYQVSFQLDTSSYPLGAPRWYDPQETMDWLDTEHDEPPNPSPEEQRRLAQCFPCQNPVNLHMSSLERRIETFDERWHVAGIVDRVEQIANAGFFCIDEGDKCVCFYCNGELQNLDPTDEPWTEHAKCFSGCEYILRHKGVQFAKRLAEAHPNLNRPYIRSPASYNDILSGDVQRTSPPQSMLTETQTRPNINITQVANVGFPREMIERFIQARERHGGYASTQELIQDMYEHGDVPLREQRNLVATLEVAGHVHGSANDVISRENQPEPHHGKR